LGTKLSQLTA